MLASMAFTTSDLDAVKLAIATGQQTVEIGDRRITYRSVEELKAAKRLIEAELNGPSASRMYPRYQVADFSD